MSDKLSSGRLCIGTKNGGPRINKQKLIDNPHPKLFFLFSHLSVTTVFLENDLIITDFSPYTFCFQYDRSICLIYHPLIR